MPTTPSWKPSWNSASAAGGAPAGHDLLHQHLGLLAHAGLDVAPLAVDAIEFGRELGGARRVVGEQALDAESHVGEPARGVQARPEREAEVERARALVPARGHVEQRRDARLHAAGADALEALRDEAAVVRVEPDDVGHRAERDEDSFRVELAAAERSYQNLIDDLRAADPDYAAARASTVPPLETLQSRLPADTALIEYVITDSSLEIFVLTSRGLRATAAPVRAADLAAKVGLLRDLLARQGDWRKPAESLRRSLLGPLEQAGWLDKISKLYIVPHGTLHYLPFALLPRVGSNRYLIEDYTVAYLPAAAALLRPHASVAQRELFAEAPARAKLPYAQEEARSIGAFFPNQSQILVGASATESSFKRNASHYRIIHLATHGYFNKLNPLFSAVELEPDQTEDGRLEVHEILYLRLNASLVTLSACDTALGSGYFAEVPAGDEFVGLTRAFLYAGSPAVLATLWEVNDRSTLDLMRGFYQTLAKSGKAEALAEAQRAMLRRGGRYAQPYTGLPLCWSGR